jgi:hypothetical protein
VRGQVLGHADGICHIFVDSRVRSMLPTLYEAARDSLFQVWCGACWPPVLRAIMASRAALAYSKATDAANMFFRLPCRPPSASLLLNPPARCAALNPQSASTLYLSEALRAGNRVPYLVDPFASCCLIRLRTPHRERPRPRDGAPYRPRDGALYRAAAFGSGWWRVHVTCLAAGGWRGQADLGQALEIVMDAKTQYPSACNSVETLLVHEVNWTCRGFGAGLLLLQAGHPATSSCCWMTSKAIKGASRDKGGTKSLSAPKAPC